MVMLKGSEKSGRARVSSWVIVVLREAKAVVVFLFQEKVGFFRRPVNGAASWA